MNAGDMQNVCTAFADAAERAMAAGFDAIELNFAHGYLLASFVSPLTNRRDDEYGGALENRLRFPLEVLGAVRSACPDKQADCGADVGERLGAWWVDAPGCSGSSARLREPRRGAGACLRRANGCRGSAELSASLPHRPERSHPC